MIDLIKFDHKAKVFELTEKIDSEIIANGEADGYVRLLENERIKSLKILLEAWRLEKQNNNHD